MQGCRGEGTQRGLVVVLDTGQTARHRGTGAPLLSSGAVVQLESFPVKPSPPGAAWAHSSCPPGAPPPSKTRARCPGPACIPSSVPTWSPPRTQGAHISPLSAPTPMPPPSLTAPSQAASAPFRNQVSPGFPVTRGIIWDYRSDMSYTSDRGHVKGGCPAPQLRLAHSRCLINE